MIRFSSVLMLLLLASSVQADVGDPQLKTDHPWYPGELACSTWDRLFATQADVYRRVTGRPCTSDEDKALAAWLWRNTHYWHGEEGVRISGAGGSAKGRTRGAASIGRGCLPTATACAAPPIVNGSRRWRRSSGTVAAGPLAPTATRHS